jgi:hypothetical protein
MLLQWELEIPQSLISTLVIPSALLILSKMKVISMEEIPGHSKVEMTFCWG